MLPARSSGPSARLLIHADERLPSGGARLACWSLGLQRWLSRRARPSPPHPDSVRVEDLRGHVLFDFSGCKSLIDLPLCSGTYHVAVKRGVLERRYTVTLEPGTTVDLHLRSAHVGR